VINFIREHGEARAEQRPQVPLRPLGEIIPRPLQDGLKDLLPDPLLPGLGLWDVIRDVSTQLLERFRPGRMVQLIEAPRRLLEEATPELPPHDQAGDPQVMGSDPLADALPDLLVMHEPSDLDARVEEDGCSAAYP
jgi:hypothetical protein